MQSVMQYDQSRAPTMSTPRANFNLSHGVKTTIDFDYIYPFLVEDVLPGDTWNVDTAAFARLATPLYPLMDNMYLDIHYFWIPMRMVWKNSRKFFGEQEDPGDSISYTIPTVTATTTTGYSELSIFDYFALPTKIPDYEHSVLPLRCYNLVYNEWFRDQNIIDSVPTFDDDTDTGAPATNYSLLKRGKRHDYFTSCLVNPVKDPASSQTLPLGTSAPVYGIGVAGTSYPATNQTAHETDGTSSTTYANAISLSTSSGSFIEQDPNNTGYPNIRADLSNATAATILQLRQAMQIQALIELDARAGTRYNEIVYATFGVTPPQDSYKPEYLGGGSMQIGVQQVPQTSNDATNGSVGQLGAYGTAFGSGNGFVKSFTEHGFILGVMSVKDPASSQTLPLGTSAPVYGIGVAGTSYPATNQTAHETDGTSSTTYANAISLSTSSGSFIEQDPNNTGYPNIRADLSNATAATILQLRQAMQIQALIELDARAGTRYNEIVYATFGVTPPQDSYKPEYLGGGSMQIGVQQVPQTSNDATNGSVGQLGAYGTAFGSGNGFVKSFTEHGFILGVMSARADLTYSQGLDKKWTRSTRYDFMHPILQNIGDQAVYVKELYCQDPATDTDATGTADNERVFGYQERYGDYKYINSKITGLFRPNAASSLEAWHLSEEFASLPSLDQSFIESNTPR